MRLQILNAKKVSAQFKRKAKLDEIIAGARIRSSKQKLELKQKIR
jgi:hypothetical protein